MGTSSSKTDKHDYTYCSNYSIVESARQTFFQVRAGLFSFPFLSKFSTARPGRFGFLTEPDLLKKT